MDRKERRPKTELEKEYESTPLCPYDPLDLERCDHNVFPPENIVCEKCIKTAIIGDLEDRCTSDAMRRFIAYEKFLQLSKTEGRESK